jgi:hypothetical protein
VGVCPGANFLIDALGRVTSLPPSHPPSLSSFLPLSLPPSLSRLATRRARTYCLVSLFTGDGRPALPPSLPCAIPKRWEDGREGGREGGVERGRGEDRRRWDWRRPPAFSSG